MVVLLPCIWIRKVIYLLFLAVAVATPVTFSFTLCNDNIIDDEVTAILYNNTARFIPTYIQEAVIYMNNIPFVIKKISTFIEVQLHDRQKALVPLLSEIILWLWLAGSGTSLCRRVIKGAQHSAHISHLLSIHRNGWQQRFIFRTTLLRSSSIPQALEQGST